MLANTFFVVTVLLGRFCASAPNTKHKALLNVINSFKPFSLSSSNDVFIDTNHLSWNWLLGCYRQKSQQRNVCSRRVSQKTEESSQILSFKT